MTRTVLLSALGVGVALVGLATAHAKPPALPSAAPQVVQALVDCRQITDGAARLQCYDTATSALQTAQTRGDVVVVDREQVRAVRRQAFGLAMPSLNLFPHAKDETPDRVTFVLARAFQAGDGRWRMVSEEGAEWSQSESEPLFADPRAGSRLEVRRGALNGYFCKLDGQSAFRCRRET